MFPPSHLQLLTYTTTDPSKGHCYRHIPPLLLPHLLRFVLPAPPGLTPVHRRGISPPSYFIVTFHLLYYSIHFSIDVFSFYFPLPPPFVLMMVISQPPPSTIHRPCQCREAMFADFRVFNGGVDKKKRTFILSPADLWQSYDIRSVGTFVVGESMAEGIMLLSLLLLYRAG